MDVSSADDRIQKLEQVIRKGDAFASQLEKQGLDISSFRPKLDSAKRSFDNGEHQKAFSLVQEFIGDLNRLKDSMGKGKAQTPKKKGKGVFALIRDSSQMEQRIMEWKDITYEWRGKGYLFEEDDSLFSHPFEEIEKRFVAIGEQIEKAENLRDAIKGLRADFPQIGKGYTSRIDDLERTLFRLGRLDDLERRIVQLRGSLTTVNERYSSLRNRVQRYGRKGLAVKTLEELLENDEDLDYIEKQFSVYDGNVEFLLKEKEKFLAFKADQSNAMLGNLFREIDKLLDDPWLLDTLVERMIALEREVKAIKEKERRAKEESTRRNEIREDLRRHRMEGFKVEMVEQLMDEDINLLEEEYDVLVRNIGRIKSLKEKLFAIDATDFEEDISGIFASMNDPSNIEAIELQINDLRERVKRQRTRSQKIESNIKHWIGMGFTIKKLEDLARKDTAAAEELMSDYEVKIARLMEIENKLKGLNLREMNDDLHKLMLKLKNPELYDSVIGEYSAIEGRINELEGVREKRKELNDFLKVWKGQGYEIDPILDQMGQARSVKDLQDILLKYNTRIASLEIFKREFQNELRGWFREDEAFIEYHMSNPEMTPQIMETFARLKDRNSKEEQRRGVIARKLDEIESKGIDTTKVRGSLTGDTETLNAEYDLFKELVKRLITLKANLLRESYKKKDDALKEKANSLTDPYLIDEYESDIIGEPVAKKGREEADLEALTVMARTAYKDKKYSEALGYYETILKLDPGNKEGNFYRKKVLLKMKNEASSEKPDKAPDTRTEGGKEKGKAGKTEGAKSNKGNPNCISCGGTGNCSWCSGEGKCTTCNGTGKYFGDTCTTCKGSGRCNVCDGKGQCSWCAM